MIQYNIVWNWAQAANRTLYTFDFESTVHYGSNYYVSVCDVFVLPDTFRCLRHAKRKDLVKDSDCVIFRFSDPGFHLNTSIATICKDVNIYKLTCLAAMLYGWDGPNSVHLYPPLIQDLFQNYTFQPYYVNLFKNWIVDKLHIDVDNTIVFHWRRGDQLNTRCKGGYDRDKSVNCDIVQEFIHLINKTKHSFNRATRNTVTLYISTNEDNSTILGELHFSKSSMSHPHSLTLIFLGRVRWH